VPKAAANSGQTVKRQTVKPKISCKYCGSPFSSRNALFKHIRIGDGSGNNASGPSCMDRAAKDGMAQGDKRSQQLLEKRCTVQKGIALMIYDYSVLAGSARNRASHHCSQKL
jgi:hypothetical protein